jgi:hypothetical protein
MRWPSLVAEMHCDESRVDECALMAREAVAVLEAAAAQHVHAHRVEVARLMLTIVASGGRSPGAAARPFTDSWRRNPPCIGAFDVIALARIALTPFNRCSSCS